MYLFKKIVTNINKGMMIVIGTLILFMAITLFYSVVMRYLFNKPLIWSFDLTEWFTGMSAFLGGGYALLRGSHVKVDIFYEKFPLRIRSFIDICTSVFLFLIVAVLIWKGSEQVVQNFQMGAVASSGLNIAVWIKWVMVPVGGLLLGLQALIKLVDDIVTTVTGKTPDEEEL